MEGREQREGNWGREIGGGKGNWEKKERRMEGGNGGREKGGGGGGNGERGRR